MINNETIHIRPFTVEDAEARLQLQLKNRDFFEQFSMIRTPDFYTLETQRYMIKEYEEKSKEQSITRHHQPLPSHAQLSAKRGPRLLLG
jgi:ribosomal-protein-alanine N-acetyltransferase